MTSTSLAAGEQRERLLEAALADVAPRADHVGPDLDEHAQKPTGGRRSTMRPRSPRAARAARAGRPDRAVTESDPLDASLADQVEQGELGSGAIPPSLLL